MTHLPSPFLIPPKPMPMTIERVEAALDKLATIMVAMGDDGPKLLPLYESIDADLKAMKAVDDGMAEVRARAKLSSDRTAALARPTGAG